jgi:hypothetical protein
MIELLIRSLPTVLTTVIDNFLSPLDWFFIFEDVGAQLLMDKALKTFCTYCHPPSYLQSRSSLLISRKAVHLEITWENVYTTRTRDFHCNSDLSTKHVFAELWLSSSCNCQEKKVDRKLIKCMEISLFNLTS